MCSICFSCKQLSDEHVLTSRNGTHQVKYEVAGFRFETPAPTLFFYCEINVCVKDGDQTRCEESCPSPSNRNAKSQKGGPDYLLTSAPISPNPAVVPVFVVDQAGNPRPNAEPAKPSSEPVSAAAGGLFWTNLRVLVAMGVALLVAVECLNKL